MMLSCRRLRCTGFPFAKSDFLCEMEINADVAGPLSRIPVDSRWPIIWHSIAIVVESSGDVVRDAGIHADNASGPEAPWQSIRADEVETMVPVIVGPPEFWTQNIVVGRQGKHSTRIVQSL